MSAYVENEESFGLTTSITSCARYSFKRLSFLSLRQLIFFGGGGGDGQHFELNGGNALHSILRFLHSSRDAQTARPPGPSLRRGADEEVSSQGEGNSGHEGVGQHAGRQKILGHDQEPSCPNWREVQATERSTAERCFMDLGERSQDASAA